MRHTKTYVWDAQPIFLLHVCATVKVWEWFCSFKAEQSEKVLNPVEPVGAWGSRSEDGWGNHTPSSILQL